MSVYVYHILLLGYTPVYLSRGGSKDSRGVKCPPPAPLNETLVGINFSGLNV